MKSTVALNDMEFHNLKCHVELELIKLKFYVMVNLSSTLAILICLGVVSFHCHSRSPLLEKPFLLSLENRVEFESKVEIHTKLKSPIHPSRIQIKLDYSISIQGRSRL